MQQMANKCQCSETLIFGIEELDWITHPDIASRIAAQYGLDLHGYNQLVHEDRRAETLPEPAPLPKDGTWKNHPRNSIEELARDLYQYRKPK